MARRGVLRESDVNELMTNHMRSDSNVPRSDEADLRRALEEAKDDKDVGVLFNAKSVCGSKSFDFLQDFKEKLEAQVMEEPSQNFDKVEIVDPPGQDYNAILFIFQTSRCLRLRLKIMELPSPNTFVKVDANEIKRLLRSQKIYLMDGKIKHLCIKSGKIILVYDFSKTTNCSAATTGDFYGVEFSDDFIDIQWESLKCKRNLAWSFFSLSDTLDDTFDSSMIEGDCIKMKKKAYLTSPLNEAERMECLYLTTKAYVATRKFKATVKKVNPLHQESHSQFSGGGDLLIATDQSTCSIVQQNTTTKSSPIQKGTAMQHLALEGKKEHYDEEKLKWQLFANMMAAAVSQFLTNLKLYYTLKDIEEVKHIVGYGVPYTGSGVVGLYKLDIQLGAQTRIITKVAMRRRFPLVAAMLVDWFYDLYLNKLQSI